MRFRTVTTAALMVAAVTSGGVPAGAQEQGGDPLRPTQWGLAQIRAPQAWEHTRGEDVTVAVIDSGVDLTHPDLAPNLGQGITFAECGDEGCGAGSWNDVDPEVRHPGGTLAAGVIAAAEGNGIGIAGVAPEATILPVRVTASYDIGQSDDVGDGIRWATAQGADVINLGLGDEHRGWETPFDATGVRLDDKIAAIEAARAGAIVVVNAAVDDGGLCHLPEVAELIACVTPTDAGERRRSPWPYGLEPDVVAVSGPGGPVTGQAYSQPFPHACGEGVVSTQPEGIDGLFDVGRCAYPDGYAEDGRSVIASAHVAGVAALLVGMGCGQRETLHLLGDTARTPGGGRGDWSPSHGYGIVDAEAATDRAAELCVDPQVPEPPCDCEGVPPGECECAKEPPCGGAIVTDFGDDALPAGWSVQTAANEDATPAWHVEWTAGRGASVTTDGSGTGRKDDRLVSPPLRAMRGTTVTFEHRYDLERRRDGAVLEYSIDDGATWSPVPLGQLSEGWYDASLKGGPLPGVPAWTSLRSRSTRLATVLTEADLGFLRGWEVRLGWRLVQDAERDDSTPGRGWWLDLVEVREVGGLPCVGPADPLRGIQYGLRHIRADRAWGVSRGEGAVVAVIDTGVDFTHPDLEGKVLEGKTFLSCGDAGCGNGSWDNGHDHGTHVSGIVAAQGDNGEGVAGVAPEAEILPVRVLGADGRGSSLDTAIGMRWAADHGADVINMSLGGQPGVQLVGPVLFPEVQAAVDYAVSKGVVIVASAGNDDFPLCGTPAYSDGIICVEATQADRLPASYSNRGVKPDLITVAAPGGDMASVEERGDLCPSLIVSTVPQGRADLCGHGEHYAGSAGTSMASPHVAGVAALLKSMGCSWQATMDLITGTAQHPITGARGEWSQPYGYGIVDAAAATVAATAVCGG
jgi:serine protease